MTSQAKLIKEELLAHKGTFVPMPRLAELAGCFAVHSRIADIRAEGYTVENKLKTCPTTGRRLSYYRIPEPDQLQLI